MRRILTNIIKYIGIFLITAIMLLALLVLTAKIPKESIKDNIVESLQFFKDNRGIEMLSARKEYRYIHYYADSILLNIIYGIDSNKPLKSVLESKYYETVRSDTNIDFINVVENDLNPNQEYIRYWHGGMIVLRPLLVYFNMNQIYLINKILLFGLSVILFVMLLFKNKKLTIIYVISMIAIAFNYVPMCFEYSWTFYIMLIVSIIAILIEKKGEAKLYKLFFIIGIITCYFDFLTTELITILVPLLFVLYIRKEENRITNFKETIKFIAISCGLWFGAYILMWLFKWMLASLVLNINAINYVKDDLLLRVNGWPEGINSIAMYRSVLWRNVSTLYPIHILKPVYVIVGMGIISGIILLFFDWKNINKKWFALVALGIALLPYVRYFILGNHSYYHSFFTFRTQIVTIIGLSIAILECLNYKLLLKDIKIKKKQQNR